MLNERGHEIGILMAEDGRINKVLMEDQRGVGGNKLPKRLVPTGSSVSRANFVVPICDVKGKTYLKAKLFSIGPEKETSL